MIIGMKWVTTAFFIAGLAFQGTNAQASLQEQIEVEQLALTDPPKAAQRVLNFHNIFETDIGTWAFHNNISGTGDDDQVPWGRGAYFSFNPWTIGGNHAGYWWLPEQFDMFKLNRTFAVDERNGSKAIAPFYVNKDYDASKIERAIVLFPGQWRDSWRYANFLGNAYRVAQKYEELGVEKDNVLLIAPVFMNEDDSKAAKPDELQFANAGWSVGGTARQPRIFKGLSSFEVMDKFVEMLFDDKRFPSMKKVVIAGHSMGGQASLHYAFLRPKTKHESKVKFWVGNPGSYVWLNKERPFKDKKCDDFDDWPYGVGVHKEIPRYARKRAGKHGQNLIDNFLDRRVHFTVAMNDNGDGVTNCRAMTQGPNRLCRASEWMVSFGNSTHYEWSKKHTANFLPGVSHQDYPSIAYYGTLKFLFTDHD